MKRNIIVEKSYDFAIRIVKLYQYLASEKREYILSKQILRSGTSIGANVEEMVGGQSKKDFLHKLSIAYKESRETRYWLRILKDMGYIQSAHFTSVNADLEEIQKILGTIIKTTKKKT
jgi:four helix bundle protein